MARAPVPYDRAGGGLSENKQKKPAKTPEHLVASIHFYLLNNPLTHHNQLKTVIKNKIKKKKNQPKKYFK
ncbi:hypothetical protein ACVGXX_09235, partial [Enterobacter intestinihominis]